ncbi:3-hydroxy-9,10-secoandrosta-1,3,5(10)-triene-9,17-dione monooxygenase reductase component [Polaromonas sp. CG_9.5]|uniref:flavin reductase n=1 Tax=Polaromonas sp. CG_9.5 TaxID=3071705 RepID=UPI002DF7C0E7|nr:3-hydroxy-9,10-secoandrosta-1,3,5(10)-triene-9,17-dione monooxygenase reductase component [Polaromonas sp. CG_9.5]
MDQPAPPFDPKDFRRALGNFATGVTIVTTNAADGTPVGITANSFNSVSLEPPMVLWSLANNARSLPVFSGSEFWNVHILSNEQEALSNRFARPSEDKFTGLALDAQASGAPLLPGCSARFQCKSAFKYEGGDHTIFVGEVVKYDSCALPPLLYVTGGYALASRKAAPVSTEPLAQLEGASYSENLLGYLFGRAHFQFVHGIRSTLQQRHLSDTDFFVLSLLSVRQPLGAEEIAAHIAYTGVDLGAAALASLVQRGLLQETGAQGLRLSPAGEDAILHVLAAAKAVEADLVGRMGELESAALRNLLKQAILATDPGLPKLWTQPI